MSTLSLEGLTLHVADVEQSLAFYARIPGAKILVHRPGYFGLLHIGTGRLGLLKRDLLPQQAQDSRFHVEIVTADLNALYEELRQAEIEPIDAPQKRPWGETDFRVIDPDGNILEFGLADDPNHQTEP